MLFQYHQSKRPNITLYANDSITDKVKEAFCLERTGDIILQKYDEEWSGWTDVTEHEIKNKDKVMVHLKTNTSQSLDQVGRLSKLILYLFVYLFIYLINLFIYLYI